MGAQRWICFFKYVTPVYKLKAIFLHWFVVRKSLSQVLEVRFHLPETCISKTCVKQGNSGIQKLGLRYGFDSPTMQYL